ncbi:hypothetical protein PM082_011673 [Marasmius tenuissimus]|nr:hypothetical protein PM082_011673 [Marasmius tenuissimus]
MAALLDIVSSLTTARYFIMAATTCSLYDHLLTFGLEVSNVWTNEYQKGWSNLLFALNRYLPEVVMIYVVYIMSGFAEALHDAE